MNDDLMHVILVPKATSGNVNCYLFTLNFEVDIAISKVAILQCPF